MDGLLQRIQREEPETGLDRRFGCAGLLLVGEQLSQSLYGQLVQPLPLGRQPLLERALGQRQPGQQLTAIETGDLLERRRPTVGDQPLELRHVHSHNRGVQHHARPVEDHAGPDGPGQGFPDPREGVAQVAPGLGVRHVSPQQARELLARVSLAERNGQVGQEGLRLPRREDKRGTGVDLGLESAQQSQLEARRHLHGPPYWTA